jgi:hypothetical protein
MTAPEVSTITRISQRDVTKIGLDENGKVVSATSYLKPKRASKSALGNSDFSFNRMFTPGLRYMSDDRFTAVFESHPAMVTVTGNDGNTFNIALPWQLYFMSYNVVEETFTVKLFFSPSKVDFDNLNIVPALLPHLDKTAQVVVSFNEGVKKYPYQTPMKFYQSDVVREIITSFWSFPVDEVKEDFIERMSSFSEDITVDTTVSEALAMLTFDGDSDPLMSSLARVNHEVLSGFVGVVTNPVAALTSFEEEQETTSGVQTLKDYLMVVESCFESGPEHTLVRHGRAAMQYAKDMHILEIDDIDLISSFGSWQKSEIAQIVANTIPVNDLVYTANELAATYEDAFGDEDGQEEPPW